MVNFDWNSRSQTAREKLIRVTEIAAPPLWAIGFVLAGIPVQPAQARYYDPPPYRARVGDYESCASRLLNTGLQAADVSAACGGALYPRELSFCVTDIESGTEVAAADALSNCRRVRRPQELATCVVGINGIKTEGTNLTDVLDYCRRSLLPVRFSNCVVGVSGQVPDASTTETMTTCIAASSRPRQVLPDFIPSGQPVPLQPLPNANTSGNTSGITSPGVTSPNTGITSPNSGAVSPTTPSPSSTEPSSTPAPSRSVPALW